MDLQRKICGLYSQLFGNFSNYYRIRFLQSKILGTLPIMCPTEPYRMTIWDLAVSRYRRNPFTSLHSSCPLVRCLSPSTILEYPPDDRGPGLSIYLYNYCQFTSHTSNFTCLTILAVFELFCNRVNILYLFFLITI